jgi:hypothetical protein
MKITRVRYYAPGRQPRKGVQSLLSSSNVICVDTDAGITGLGEGGTRDTLEHCASALIGQDPSRIELHWQNMFRGNFYPTGKEKLHALGGLDIALWDIKAKALGVPIIPYQIDKARLNGFFKTEVQPLLRQSLEWEYRERLAQIELQVALRKLVSEEQYARLLQLWSLRRRDDAE